MLSDEIHAPLTHSGVAFTPYLTVSDAARRHGITAVSASKAFNLAGLKCAFFVAESDAMAALIAGLPEEVTSRAGIFGVLATTAGFREAGGWLDATIADIEANLTLLDAELHRSLPLARLRRPDASYLAWVDLSRYGWGPDPATHLLREARVAFTSGPLFGPGGEGHVRINVACAHEVLTEAIGRVAALV